MANTKQKAKKAAGGRAPRSELAMKAARKVKYPWFAKVHKIAACWVESRRKGGLRFCFEHTRLGPRCLDETSFVDVFGPGIYRWCKKMPQCKLRVAEPARWDFLEQYGRQDDSAASWAFRRIKLSDGQAEGEIEGRYYASADKRGQKWYPILLHTMEMENVAGVPPGIGGKVARGHHVSDEGVVVLGSDPMYLCVNAVDCWCVAHKGRSLRLDRPERQWVSRNAKSYYRVGYPVLYRTGGDTTCVLAPFLNGISTVGRKEDADDVMRSVLHGRVPESRVRDLADLSKWFFNAVGRYSLVHVPGLVDPSPNWLMQQKGGIFLISLRGTGFENHMVVVDAKRKLIFDGMERFALKLCPQALAVCLGNRKKRKRDE